MNRTLVWSDHESLALELARGARSLGSDPTVREDRHVAMAVFGGPLPVALPSPADQIVWISEASADDADWCVDALCEVVARTDPNLVLVGATKLGLEVAPRVAERLSAAYVPWSVGFDLGAADHTATCTSYAGAGQTTMTIRGDRIVATVAPGVLGGGGDAPETLVESMVVAPRQRRVVVLGDRPKPKGASLAEASTVLDVGQGIRERADLSLIEQLAGLLDAQIACSRPLAAERDWFPEWLGLSGARIKARLCLTIGVSGAIQHIVGIRDSQVIAAVNSDENAPIFAQADVGVVADLYEFLPVLMRRLTERGVAGVKQS
jgi:electron transfer flavoprotein alpha subunit